MMRLQRSGITLALLFALTLGEAGQGLTPEETLAILALTSYISKPELGGKGFAVQLGASRYGSSSWRPSSFRRARPCLTTKARVPATGF
jgi:hypothetical protein